jgi:hypothetical protein
VLSWTTCHSPQLSWKSWLSSMGKGLEFVDYFGQLPTSFRKLHVTDLRLRDFSKYNDLLTSCGSTLDQLKIQGVYDGELSQARTSGRVLLTHFRIDRVVQTADVPPLNLENNTVLRRLRITLHESIGRPARSVGWMRDLLLSIRSSCLSEIKFIVWQMKSTDKGSVEWKDIDRILVGLCKNRGSEFKVVFGVTRRFPWEYGVRYVEQILPGVKEAGALVIVWKTECEF